jgi:hypothetical protein
MGQPVALPDEHAISGSAAQGDAAINNQGGEGPADEEAELGGLFDLLEDEELLGASGQHAPATATAAATATATAIATGSGARCSQQWQWPCRRTSRQHCDRAVSDGGHATWQWPFPYLLRRHGAAVSACMQRGVVLLPCRLSGHSMFRSLSHSDPACMLSCMLCVVHDVCLVHGACVQCGMHVICSTPVAWVIDTVWSSLTYLGA